GRQKQRRNDRGRHERRHGQPAARRRDGSLAPDAMADARSQLWRRRVAWLPSEELPQLTLGGDAARALPALHAVTVELGDVAHRELAVHVGMELRLDLSAGHSASFT